MGIVIKHPLLRFWKKLKFLPNGCWLWLGGKDKDGYGVFYYQQRQGRAARFSYEAFNGHLPTNLVPDHLCRCSSCVNPNHLEAVTPRENTKRGNNIVGRNMDITHCMRGHELAGINLYTRKNGQRKCRTCHRQREYIPNILRRRAQQSD